MLKIFGLTPNEVRSMDYGECIALLELDDLINKEQNRERVKEEFHRGMRMR